jgi:hypothetical protein
MARTPRADQTESFGSDSFLDIVSNIVGILIILVMVVSVRVKSVTDTVELPPAEPPAPTFDLASAQASVTELEGELQQVSAVLSNSEIEVNQNSQRLNLLASSIRSAKDGIEHERAIVEAKTQAAGELAEELEAKRRQYEALLFEVQKQEDIKPKSVRIDSFQTPISRTVLGKEIHFQLKGGLIAHVPMEELVEKMADDFRSKLQFMKSTPELTNVVGPIEGFRCRYTGVRVDSGSFNPMFDQVAAQLRNATFVPESDSLGESLEESLSASSRFRSIVGRLEPGRAVITLWTYPDSFNEFRQLRRELYQLGFSVAARPLPFGHPIGVSSAGSRSLAQ